jgi:hypothetical protein
MKPTGDKIFDYNVKVFNAIFGTKPDLAELDRDRKIEQRQEAKEERVERFNPDSDEGALP